MFITIEYITNIGISEFENTSQVQNLFINFELKVSMKGGETQSSMLSYSFGPQLKQPP